MNSCGKVQSEAPARAETALKEMRAWVASPALGELVAAFGGPNLLGIPFETALEILDKWTESVWDFRRGAERRALTHPLPEIAHMTSDHFMGIMQALGLTGDKQPDLDRYDFLVVLGGMARACILRTAHAATLVEQRPTLSSKFVAVTAARSLSSLERELIARLNWPAMEYEADVMREAARRLIPSSAPSQTPPNARNTARPLGKAGEDFGITVSVYTKEFHRTNGMRGDTSSTLAHWASGVRLNPETKILVITTGIYVPYQRAATHESLTLRTGCLIDVVPVSKTTGLDLPEPAVFGAPNYLQEVRSTIRGIRSFYMSYRQLYAGPA